MALQHYSVIRSLMSPSTLARCTGMPSCSSTNVEVTQLEVGRAQLTESASSTAKHFRIGVRGRNWTAVNQEVLADLVPSAASDTVFERFCDEHFLHNIPTFQLARYRQETAEIRAPAWRQIALLLRLVFGSEVPCSVVCFFQSESAHFTESLG